MDLVPRYQVREPTTGFIPSRRPPTRPKNLQDYARIAASGEEVLIRSPAAEATSGRFGLSMGRFGLVELLTFLALVVLLIGANRFLGVGGRLFRSVRPRVTPALPSRPSEESTEAE